MEISEFTEVLMEAKDDKGLSFEDLGKIIGRSEMWTAALLFGQSKATEEEARKITSALGLEEEEYIELFELFVETGMEDLNELWIAIDMSSTEKAARIAHSLKGAAFTAEKKRIIEILENNAWNKAKTARDLNIDYKTLYNKIKRYGIKK